MALDQLPDINDEDYQQWLARQFSDRADRRIATLGFEAAANQRIAHLDTYASPRGLIQQGAPPPPTPPLPETPPPPPPPVAAAPPAPTVVTPAPIAGPLGQPPTTPVPPMSDQARDVTGPGYPGATTAFQPPTPEDVLTNPLGTRGFPTGIGPSGLAPTTAELSGGGPAAAGLSDRARRIMASAAASASWLGPDGQKALQAILMTEGGLDNARGDQGASAGPLQFYGTPTAAGQLTSFARQRGLSLDQARVYVEAHPEEAVAWAIGTPDAPGYLGAALQAGQNQGLSGAALATYGQRRGQVSVSPDRAGFNYNALFGGGAEPITAVPTGQPTTPLGELNTRYAPPRVDISQFGDPQLTNDEAYAACGPAAAVRFAQRYGRNPTLREALDLARTVGWTPTAGMAGIASEKALMDKLGIPTRLVEGAQWGAFANEANTGNPVTISTSGHYFTADGYDPTTNRFHVGRSGLDLRGGKEWMTPDEMTSLMGPVQGALFADNPQVAAPSTVGAVQDPEDWINRQRDAYVSSLTGQPTTPTTSAPTVQTNDPDVQQLDNAVSVTVRTGDQTQRRLGQLNEELAPTPQPSETTPPITQFFNQVGQTTGSAADRLKSAFSDFVDQVGTTAGQAGTTVTDFLSGETARRNREQPYPESIQQTARDLAAAQSGAPPPTVADVVGGIGSALGTGGQPVGGGLTVPAYQELNQRRREQVEAAIPEDVRNFPVLGGAATMTADILTDPTTYLLAGPVGRAGEAIGRIAGGGYRGAAANQAVQGALFNAIQAAQKPGATPQDIALAAAEGAVGGAAIGAGGRAVGQGAEYLASPAGQALLRTKQSGAAEAEFAATGGLGRLFRPGEDAVEDAVRGLSPEEVAVERGRLVLPGEQPTGPSQILGPRGEVLSTVARREEPLYVPGRTGAPVRVSEPVVGIGRTRAGAEAIGEASPETIARMPNVAKLAPELPEVAATLQRQAEENGALMDLYRQGRVSHQDLIDTLAPRLGLTSEQFLKTRVGRAFNAEELLALRSAVIAKQVEVARMAEEIAAKGGVGALTDEERVAAMTLLTDAARLQAVGRGAAATAGRALNQQKIVLSQEMAQAITGGNEARLAEQAQKTAQAKVDRIARLTQKNQELAAEKRAAVTEAQRVAADSKQAGLFDQIAQAYDELAAYQAMTLHEKADDFAKRAAERAALEANRKAKDVSAPEALLKALQDELAAERKVFAGSKKAWETMAFYASKRGERLKLKGELEGPAVWLKAQEQQARREMNIAQQRQITDFNLRSRVAERQTEQAGRLLERLGGREVTDDVLKSFITLQNTGDPLAMAQFLRAWSQPGTRLGRALNRIGIIRYGSMLSSTATHLANAVGNTAQIGLGVGLKPLEVGIDIARARATGGPRTRYMAELSPQVGGLWEGAVAGWKDAATLMRTGINPRLASNLEGARPGFGVNPVVDTIAELPLRALEAADLIFRGAARGGASRSLAVRRAISEGYSGDMAHSRADEIFNNLTSFPDLLAEAEKSAARSVYQEPGGRLVTAVAGNPWARIFLPFVRTPYNIAAQGIGMTPAGFAGVIAAARRGETSEATERAARALFGTGVMALATGLGAAGYLTGARPESAKDRSMLPPDWQPWSLRIPHPDGQSTYVSFSNLGAVGVPLAMGAIAGDATRRVGAGKDVDPVAMAMGVGRYALDQTFLRGLSDVVHAVEDPSRYAENISEGLASQLMPYGGLQRQIERAIGMAPRDPHGAVEALAGTFLPTAGLVQPRTDVLGREVQPDQSGLAAFISPFRYETTEDTPALRALREADVGIAGVPKSLTAREGTVAITPAEQKQIDAARGRLIEQWVQAEMASPGWSRLNREGRNRVLQDLVTRASSAARSQFINALPAAQFNERRKPGGPTPPDVPGF